MPSNTVRRNRDFSSSHNERRPATLRLERLEPRDTPAKLGAGFTEATLATGLLQPTAFAHLPDRRILIAEQAGTVRMVKNRALLPGSVLNISTRVDSQEERGLLGIAVDPNFSSNKFIYVYYTTNVGSAHNRVSRFQMLGDTVLAASERIVLDLDPLPAVSTHNGGAIHFGTDGKLYIATGDLEGSGSRAQSLDSSFGKILRIFPDGSVPTDNPFYFTGNGITQAIWAYGFRNPYTFDIQTGTGRMFLNDVGTAQFEEINDIQAAGNYGWSQSEGPTTNPNFQSPFFSYGNGRGSAVGCAITGGSFYNPKTQRFPLSHKGDYFFADYCSGWIRRLDLATKTVTSFASNIPFPVDLHTGSDGQLYYLARGSSSNSGFLVAVNYVFDVSWKSGKVSVPSSAIAGRTFTVSRTYRVAGTSAPSTIAIRYIASKDGIRGNADDIVLGTEAIRLASGKTVGLHTGSFGSLKITRKGTYTIFGVLDPNNTLSEVVESNNSLGSVAKIKIV